MSTDSTYTSEDTSIQAEQVPHEHLRERFCTPYVPDWIDATWRITGKPPVWFIDGPVSLASLNVPRLGGTLIVNGDLDVAGDIDLICGNRNVLVVKGTLRARNVRFGSSFVDVDGDIRVAKCLMCAPCEEATIVVRGTIAAQLAVFEGEVRVEAKRIEGVVCADEEVRLPKRVYRSDPIDVLVAEVLLDDEDFEADEVWERSIRGERVLA